MNFNKLFIISTLFFANDLQPKVLIITHAFLRPDFIETQYYTFKKFMLDDYEFVVFNDARNPDIREQINQKCSEYELKCIEIPQEIHDRPYLQRGIHDDYNHSAARCANVVQYSLDILGFDHDGMVMIIDSDMFLIRKFSVVNYLSNNDIAGLPQVRNNTTHRVDYLWNGLLFFNMNTLPNKQLINFNCGWVEGILTDVGGYTYYYFKQNPKIKVKNIDGHIYLDSTWCNECRENNFSRCSHNTQSLKNIGFNNPLISLTQSGKLNMELFLFNTFLHYRGGGNWDQKSAEYHEEKTNLLNIFIEEIIDEMV